MSLSEPAEKKVIFLLDVIVTRLELYKDKIDNPKQLSVGLKFNNIPINITASRINVTEFKSGRRTEFKDDPSTLRKTIEENGMSVAVRYTGLTLGTAQIPFPQCFIDRIQNGMSDLLHAETCSIIRRKMEIGSMELLCILVIKCEEIEKNIAPFNKSYGSLGTAINPTDIMFVVGDQDTCPDVNEQCNDDMEPEEGDEQLKLDLSRYPNSNQRATELLREVGGNEACSRLKALTDQYGDIIDSVVKEVTNLPSPLTDGKHVFTDWSGKQRTYTNKAVDYKIPIPLGDTEEMGVKPIRFCPVCLNPMSWLPKYDPCPKCCTKAISPVYEDFDEIPCADQIIQEVLDLPAKSVDNFGDEPMKKSSANYNRCTCKGGMLCTHCRIRNLCQDIFSPRQEPKGPCPKVKPKTNEDFCVVVDANNVSPEKCRPYLERVFAELQDLYTKRDSDNEDALKKRYSQSFLKGGHVSEEKLPVVVKKSLPSGLQRKSQAPKFGHKTCLKKTGMVSRRHGWAWPSTTKARKYGWRPGAICRYAGVVMRYFLQYSQQNNAFSTCRRVEEEENEKYLPILNVRKKNGLIYITLRAVNNPHVQMKPIVFRIAKSNLAYALRDIKKKLKDNGFRKCTCHQTVMMCACRQILEKKQLEYALQKECKRRGIANCVDHLVLTDTSDSEMEYDFDVSPPTTMGKPMLAIKPRTVNMLTQTDPKERKALPRYPVKLGPYWRAYDCAAGDRYTGTAFGAPGETVFEDGLFGHRGGGPHGASATPGGRGKPKGIWGTSPGGPMRGKGGVGIGGGVGGGTGGKAFPGAKKKPTGPSPNIPVRMPRRHVEAVKQAAQAVKDAVKNEIERKKKGINVMKYLMEKGTVPTPWNPNEPKREVKTKSGPVVGPDGLTDAQRRRRALNQMCIPPLDSLPRLGKGYDPCIQCNSHCPQWYGSCGCNC